MDLSNKPADVTTLMAVYDRDKNYTLLVSSDQPKVTSNPNCPFSLWPLCSRVKLSADVIWAPTYFSQNLKITKMTDDIFEI